MPGPAGALGGARASSTLKKRKTKMNKHKRRKLRKRYRFVTKDKPFTD